MSTWIITHESCLRHDTGPGHPESAQRLETVLDRLRGPDFGELHWQEAPRAEREQLIRVHNPGYVDQVLGSIPEHGSRFLDGDTVVCPASGEAALRAAGAACAAVDAVLAGETRRVFCAVRPPGHHAEPDRAMGFCLFNNVAVAAAHARAAHHLERVAVVDFDVHHGNGTQAMFGGKRGLFYASTHEHPLFPGTGGGPVPGAPNVVNVPLPPMTDSAHFRDAFREHVIPALRRFGPELTLISAGFDAHGSDPLANMELTEEDLAWATREIAAVAARFGNGWLISTLEGGYNLRALGDCVEAHVRALSEE
ncbi:histone deacetylase family protein [Aquisalimonas lutea]|uniref:histone deacetylase family protein n=1 Tax=Aquisalimonas lutea TaxID=1327750 RepID=UPI0025B39E2E|nr:histone deacetylase family protein [Aquisalimonas lutea]MDN3516128.1 histone deacetylase family protein [Aquisalimonas lutea]